MDLIGVVEKIEASGIGEWMRTTVKAVPVVEAIHVMAIAVVFGTILVVDLRLLGLRDTRRPYTQVSRELLGWTWAAFVVAAITGAMMFAANAMTYYENTPFRLKMLALVAAGLNMAVFHLITGRDVDEWDTSRSAPAGGRVAGALSILTYGLALAAFRMADTPRLAALRETSILFATAIAVFALKEKLTAGRFMGITAIATGAAVLIASG